MSLTSQQRALAQTRCPVAFDPLTCALYATDASIYQVEPIAVAFPRNAPEAAALFQAAADAQVPITPRGAGTGLVGGAIGNGVVVDFARHNQQITDLDLEKRSVRVGAGVVLDTLNAYLRPFGFGFGPDVATSSRATLGGMIANNSSGARAPLYGTTAAHVLNVQAVLADGRIAHFGPESAALEPERKQASSIVLQHLEEIRARMPADLVKRWPGYALDRFAREPHNLAHLLSGSEGTLAGILAADLKIVSLPKEKGLGLIFFDTVPEAMQATVALLDLNPAAIEHIDHVLLDQTRGQRSFQAARAALDLDAQPCESILLVEVYDAVADKLSAIAKRKLGRRTLLLHTAREMNLVWGLRKAGLSLLTSRKGPAKPVTCVEDTAVRPKELPAYVAGLESIMRPLGVEVCYYGHAASGLLHVRPVLDLRRPGDLRKLRLISDQVSALVRQFRGSLSAEHGVGMARTEYLPEHFGPELMAVMRSIKTVFDPKHQLNPGKIIGDGRFAIDQQLRVQSDRVSELPFEPVLAFAAKDDSFLGNLEQCNGCGGCRKPAPTMCPTFLATGDELMSTRGRANVIRAALNGRLDGNTESFFSPELELALSNCLGCKACTTECPSNVNLTLLKAELQHARQRRFGLSWRERLLSSVDGLGKLGCLVPGLSNAFLKAPWFRAFLHRAFDLSASRPLPPYARQRFDRWFALRQQPASNRAVILWDDTFVRYHEPDVGIAAVRVLHAAGYAVRLVQGRRCCGRPAFSQGRLDKAAQLARHNLNLVTASGHSAADQNSSALPILFLEPSCYSMFAEDYAELKVQGAASVAGRCFLFEDFLQNVLKKGEANLEFAPGPEHVAIHAHCHSKALGRASQLLRLAERLPGTKADLLDSGCCGMAGAFGLTESKRELSLKVAEPLIDLIRAQPPNTAVVASGTSCRQQIADLAAARPLHIAELLAAALP